MSIIFEGNTKNVDMEAALTALATAYESKDAEKIASAKENAKDTLSEKNRLARRDFYKSLVTADVVETRKAILTAGYIPQQKLVDKVKNGIREISLDVSESPVDILEVNRLVRAEIFNDAFVVACARIFRDGACAYVANELEKTGIEDKLGFSAVKYTGKSSMNNLASSLQRVFDETLFIDNDGKNLLLAKKSDVKTITYWMTSKASHYGAKFSATETIIRYITDILWAKLNNKDLAVDCGDVKF